MDWLKIAKNYREEFIETATALLQIPTLLDRFDPDNKEAPFGLPIREALDFMLEMGEKDGFKIKNIDNYAGHIEYGEGEEILGILGHLDVVPAGGHWHQPPFSAYLKDNKIYARGTMDDKGPTVAAYLALKMVKDQGINLNKRVRIILGCDEESGMRGLKRYLEKEKMPDLGFAPDAEFPLIYAEKGILTYNFTGQYRDPLILSMEAGERYNVVPDVCTVRLSKNYENAFLTYLADHHYEGNVEGDVYTIQGKNAHAAMPHLGLNAISLMVEFLKQISDAPFIRFLDKYLTFDHLGEKFGIDCEDPDMKELTNNLAYIHYQGLDLNIGCNIRYPKNFDVIKGGETMAQAASQYGLSYSVKEDSKPHFVSPDDILVKSLHQAYIKYTGDTENKIITIGGGTYARKLAKAVAFGPLMPGKEELAHQANEYLDIDEMMIAMAIYAESIERLAGE